MAAYNRNQSVSFKNKEIFILWLVRHWIIVISCLFGLFVILPLMAPLLMAEGWEFPAKLIYWFYSYLCHQLPERSYFLFGPKISYTLSEIQSVWQNTTDAIILRQFIGNSQMGWKVAWSDRMVSMFTSIWVFGVLWGVFKKKIIKLRWWMAFIFILPMAIDGTTHLISDFAGLGQGFRDTNVWLAIMTNHSLASTFYAGDAWGSFNAWMRLITGILFGFGTVWFGFPLLDEWAANSIKVIDDKYEYQRLIAKEKDRFLILRLSSLTRIQLPKRQEVIMKFTPEKPGEFNFRLSVVK
jgi:uncharacterized membrane protein